MANVTTSAVGNINFMIALERLVGARHDRGLATNHVCGCGVFRFE